MAAALRTASLSVLKWQSISALRRTVQLAASNPYDVLVIEHSQLAPYGVVDNAAVKCIDMHNIESELFRNFTGNANAIDHPRKYVPTNGSPGDGAVLRSLTL